MKLKLISFGATTGLIIGIGFVGATGAQAETRLTGSPVVSLPIVSKPNFVPPTDGGGTSPALGNSNSAGQQVCSVVTYISNYVGFWQKVANVNKWVEVAIYSSALVCTIVYR
jgi:hypothetical protein